MASENSVRENVDRLIAQNYVVFPVQPNDKKPMVSGNLQWTLENSKNYKFPPDCNLGIVLGSSTKLMVVDIDVKEEGLNTWNELTQLHGEPQTPCEQTPSGGLHYYFQYNPKISTRIIRANKVGIDILTNGGYVVVSPSRINSNQYKWKSGKKLGDIPLQPLPKWLEQWILKSKKKETTETSVATNSVEQTRIAPPNKIVSRDDILIAQELLSMLDQSRAENYDDWIHVGFSLRHLEKQGLKMWIEFSKRCPEKYQEGECQEKWVTMRKLETGHLWVFAKEDNPEKYQKFIQLRFKSLYEGERGHAKVIQWYLQDELKTIDETTGKGYFWDENEKLWVLMEPTSIIQRCYTILEQILHKEAMYLKNQEESEVIKSKQRELQRIEAFLRYEYWAKHVFTAAHPFFFDRDRTFRDKMDCTEHLLPIQIKQVVDLKTGKVRLRKKKDYFSQELKVQLGNAQHPDIQQFIQSVMHNAETREFLQVLTGYCLTAKPPIQEIFVLFGEGSNGKSVWIELLRRVVGNYAFECDKNLFLKRTREIHCAATIDIRGKRVALCTESEDGDEFNAGALKQMSGGDNVYGRSLYNAGENFQNKAKLILCTNHPPKIKGTEQALINRLYYLEWASKFVDDPNPNNAREKKKDQEFIDRLTHERINDFFAYAVEGAVKYYATGLPKNRSIQSTKDKQVTVANPLGIWLDERIEKGEDKEKVCADDLWDQWLQDYSFNDFKDKAAFFKAVRAHLKVDKNPRSNGKSYIKGFRLKRDSDEG